MKLFYTEDEAMAEELILTTEQPAFIKAYILPSMYGSIRAQYSKVIQHMYHRVKICSNSGATLKCTYFYILEGYKDKVVKELLKAYNGE